MVMMVVDSMNERPIYHFCLLVLLLFISLFHLLELLIDLLPPGDVLKKGTGEHRTGPFGEISFPNLSSYSSPDRYSSGPWTATWHGQSYPYGQIITLVIGCLTYTPLVICVFECLLDLMILSSMYSRPSTWLLLNLTCTNPF